MATEAKSGRRGRRRDRGRVPYRLTVDQFLAMRLHGIIGDDEDLELWAGRLYKMTKNEPHNFAVMATAEALRGLISGDYHVREEKSARQGDRLLPEPDVAVARGTIRSYVHEIPTLDRLALVVEVCASTRRSDFRSRPRVYARAGIPVYWVVDLTRREIVVFGDPRPRGSRHSYGTQTTFGPGQALDVIIDGDVRGRVAVEDLLPPPKAAP